MNHSQPISDEAINALVDGELSVEERLELLNLAITSKDLQQRICDRERLKAEIVNAYPLIDTSPPEERRHFLKYASGGLLSGLLLFSGLSLLKTPSQPSTTISAIDDADATLNHSPTRTQVVFHISSDDSKLAKLLLEQVSFLLNHYHNKKHSIQLEVVANNDGLRLLQSGRSECHDEIKSLTKRYQNLIFAACGTTMARLQSEENESISILPEAIIIQSGVAFITRRQSQGWSYIKV